MSSIGTVTELPTLLTDSKMCGFDGDYSLHSILLIIHSRFLKETVKSIPENSKIIFILPDYPVQEIITLSRVMYGLDKSGMISQDLLKTLGFSELETSVTVEYVLEETILYDGPLEDLVMFGSHGHSVIPQMPPENSFEQSSSSATPQFSFIET